jgi:LysM repeat protein
MSYVVKSGDTLGAIANQHDTTVSAILVANPSIKNPNSIYPGQRISIPGHSAPAPKPPAPKPPSAGSYTVKPGDTLGEIAADNGTTVSELLEANPQIKNPNAISVGQKLNLPKGASGGADGGGGGAGGSGGGGSAQQAPQPSTPSQNGPWVLQAAGDARKLVLSDFQTAARQIDCETAAVRAVAEVESGGRTGFDTRKRPKILFECHHFQKHTNHKYDRSHPHLSAAYKSALQRASYKKDQYTVLREAFALNPAAACMSASWGMFQVLGSNYKMCGWTGVRQFVTDMFESEAQHMRAFLGYCRGAGITRHLKTRNWAGFAHGYNGASYKDFAYDTKMANAYARYRRQG